MSKCTNCVHYMEVTYHTKQHDTKAYCLKLEDALSINIPIEECNQFVPNMSLVNDNPIKT